MLQFSGKFLSVIVNGEICYIFNCLTFGEEDEEKSAYHYVDGMIFGFERIEYKDKATEHLVFKSKMDSCISIFFNERFKTIVESYELTVLLFANNLTYKIDID